MCLTSKNCCLYHLYMKRDPRVSVPSSFCPPSLISSLYNRFTRLRSYLLNPPSSSFMAPISVPFLVFHQKAESLKVKREREEKKRQWVGESNETHREKEERHENVFSRDCEDVVPNLTPSSIRTSAFSPSCSLRFLAPAKKDRCKWLPLSFPLLVSHS